MKKQFFFLFILFLGGCSSILSERIPCPKTAIIAEFAKTIDFQDKIPIRTEIDSLYPRCDQNGNQIYIDLRLRMTSLRPFSGSQAPMKVKPSYFVAVVNKAGNILSRTNHDLDVTFAEKQTTKVDFQRLQEIVPLGEEVTVYVGFNLDESQLNYLQKERDKKTHDHRP